jgi:hypothetical protein
MAIEFEVFKRLHYDISSVFVLAVTLEKDVSTELLCGETAADEENSCLATVTKSRLCLLIDFREEEKGEKEEEEEEEIIRFSIAIK